MEDSATIPDSVLKLIGRTRLVRLGRIVPEGCATILLKIEADNPTGSMKDRMALSMIEAAERDGRLNEGGHCGGIHCGEHGRVPRHGVLGEGLQVEHRDL